MTPHQIDIVRTSWLAIAADLDTLTAKFYTFLFDIDASAARLFNGVDMAAQREKLALSLAVLVKALDDPDRLLPALAALGKRHVNYGVDHRHFHSVGEALLRAIAATLGDACTRDVHDAWTEAYALVSAVMRRALIRARHSESAIESR